MSKLKRWNRKCPICQANEITEFGFMANRNIRFLVCDYCGERFTIEKEEDENGNITD